jgi:hypothetical protein
VGVGADDAIERILSPSPGVAYPPPSGSVVGTLRLTTSGEPVGRVPVLVADLEPPPEPAGSWWWRAAGALSGAISTIVAGLLG